MSEVLLAWALAHGVTQQQGPVFLLLLHWKGLRCPDWLLRLCLRFYEQTIRAGGQR